MIKKKIHTVYLTLSVQFLALFFSCNSSKTLYMNELVSGFQGKGTYPLLLDSLIENFAAQSHTFGDSLSLKALEDIWYFYNNEKATKQISFQEPDYSHLIHLFSLLKQRGYTIARLSPLTYEGIYALSKLPVLVWTTIIHHQNHKNNFITNQDLSIYNKKIAAPFVSDMRIHLMNMIDVKDLYFKIKLHNGLVLHGIGSDTLSAQILSDNANQDSGYIQIVDCLIVTLLPLVELREHINEWYLQRPPAICKPQVLEFNNT